ncbi:MAG: glycosyltransferase [Acidobacteriaceae bacterium]|nr:glycosyltransferase [Acidobacteriaceae bacterium]
MLSVALFLLVFLGMIPALASFAQLLLVGLHGSRNHYKLCRDYTPRIAFVLPAWNEGDVIRSGIDSLMDLDYPQGHWRIYVVDDASTDDTPLIAKEKMAQYPGTVFHLRRDKGGQGKSHTLNHGLKTILADDWAEAVMIMDADVLFERQALRRMTRHLADPEVGAVTAYIKEGSFPNNVVTRFITFEYVTAQAAARRAQNVVGVMACLAGGAQLHSRENLEALGGVIDTSSLAEDTFTTLKTQLQGKRVVFEGNAVVWAEEPGTLTALWKQRLRWARGNLQLTVAFRHLWFRRSQHSKLGSVPFGILWFSIVFMPIFMILASAGLIGMYAFHREIAWSSFSTLWGTLVSVYLFETLFSYAIDPATAKRAWFEGFVFPGLISLAIMALFFLPHSMVRFLDTPASASGYAWSWHVILTLLIYSWASLSMLAAWGIYRLEKAGAPKWLCNTLLLLVGYGPQLCAIGFAALVAYCRGTKSEWDKTIKSGKVRILR